MLPPDNLYYINQDSAYTFELSVQENRKYNTTEANLNQEPFSLFNDGDSVLYVGTAGGIDRTTDNGASWYRFSHQKDPGMSGNWVVWITGNDYGGKHYIWGVTRNTYNPGEVSALSYTTEEGTTWHYILSGHSFHSLALSGDIVYGASDDGLFRTSDVGLTSQVITNIYDNATGQANLSPIFDAVAVQGRYVWVSTNDGTAVGVDDGTRLLQNQWRVFRSYVSVDNTHTTYFYPNPFSPQNDVGRVHYRVESAGSSVTIRIFDFSMHIVRTLLQNAARSPGQRDEPWDGRGSAGKLVANGVYFYSVTVNNQTSAWGKILVVR